MIAKVGWRIFFILLSAGAIAYSVYEYLDSLRQTTVVMVAAKEIPQHTLITEEMVKPVEVAVDSARLLVHKPSTSKEEVVGGITLQKIEAGKPFELDPQVLVFPEQRHLYLRKDGSVDVTYFIPKEKRLITVALPPASVVDNRLKKGDWVDVIYSAKSEAAGGTVAHMILQQIEVFDIEPVTGKGADRGNTLQHVTLLVSPQEAVKLSLAKNTGNLDLILNPWNGDRERVTPVTNSLLLN
ncbi:Flp pilus assembly protein CpaB [Brevibacillus composti]|uniref:Flp pilus assembly protein CpaB n=1 Tax=Brevibacillus composti TaxID=2796470 RepID=A0A7T5ELF7_9BACL|nr:Flp pilus assembly protein CpaB [Brevibacillus composti]QQE74753.1 Flp pilus assembly protein CpaB [Brevibacillus composti]QUO41838.1 Flp pilus assembly protein CpaB [Brevibacillus composti]